MYTRKTGSKPKKRTSWVTGNSSSNSKKVEKDKAIWQARTTNLVWSRMIKVSSFLRERSQD